MSPRDTTPNHPHDHGHPHDHEHSRADQHERGHDHDHVHAHTDHHEHGHDHDHEHCQHAHAHAHEHEHEHEHEHGTEPEAGAARPLAASRGRRELERGCGEGKILFLDAPSGIAGDMTIAALVDLGVPFSEVISAVGSLGLQGFSIEITGRFAGAIGASHFEVRIDRAQPERSYAEIDAILARAPLPPRTQSLARARMASISA